MGKEEEMILTKPYVEFTALDKMSDADCDRIGDFIFQEMEKDALFLTSKVLEKFGVRLRAEVNE